MRCEFGANLVQHLMRQHEKYQTICDYTPTISHDMSVTHDIKRCETPMQKLQEITYPEWDFQTALTLLGAVFLPVPFSLFIHIIVI